SPEEYHPAPRIQDVVECPSPQALVDPPRDVPRPTHLASPEPLQEKPERSGPSVTRRVLRTLTTALVAIALVGVAIALLLDKDLMQRTRSDTQPQQSSLKGTSVLQHQVDSLANDLATVRQDVARLQASQQNLTEQLIGLTQAISRLEQSRSSLNRRYSR